MAGPSAASAVDRLEKDGWTEQAATGDPSLPRLFARKAAPSYNVILLAKPKSSDVLASCVVSNPAVEARQLIASVSSTYGEPNHEGRYLVWHIAKLGVELRASTLEVIGGDGRSHLDLAARYGVSPSSEKQS